MVDGNRWRFDQDLAAIIPATTAGSYTFSLTGTDASNAKITASTNVTVSVQ